VNVEAESAQKVHDLGEVKDKKNDSTAAAARLGFELGGSVARIEMVESIFFRKKGAYLGDLARGQRRMQAAPGLVFFFPQADTKSVFFLLITKNLQVIRQMDFDKPMFCFISF
jgi:hypothetical protein